MDGRVPHSAADAALRSAAAGVGRQFRAQHRAEARAAYWSPMPRVYNLTRLSSAGELRGLDVEGAAQLQGDALRDQLGEPQLHARERRSTSMRDWGLDAKVGVTSSLNLDLTYNTDFAQVEVDEQQINLTRFNLLFPGEAAVLPRESRTVRGRPERRDRSVLQPPDRHRRESAISCRSRAAPVSAARPPASTSAC